MRSFAFFLLLASTALASSPIRVPQGRPIMTDGICGEAEWKGAARLSIGTPYEVRLSKTVEYVNLCIERPTETMLWADLYVASSDGAPVTLHASAKLGERKLESAKWKDFTTDWPWWSISGWWANTLRPTNSGGYLPHKAIEYQLSRERFASRSLRILFEIEGTKHVFPTNANNLDTKSWLLLNL